MTGPRSDVRRSSIRVALGATGLVALAYLAIASTVFLLVTRDLTGQVDQRLAESLARIETQPPPPPGGGGFERPDTGPRFGPQLLIWTIASDGSVVANPTDAPDLPAEYRQVGGPETIAVDGVDIRVQGQSTSSGYVVVGQTMSSVQQAQQTILLAELVIAPILLIVVFVGAIAIGRRVAAPVEASRRRQLEFTADASHELRTPLSVIEAETTLALARDREAEWYRGAFGRVERESKRMRRLLDDLLWLARFDAARGVPEAEPVDLGILAAHTADRFASVAEARSISLVVAVEPGAHVVNAPAEWLDRLLGVLLDNACKYSPQGGDVRLRVARTGGRVEVSVDDAGPGIPAEERARIFDRFHRATETGTGAGLGLAIGDAIVRGTNGRWRVATSPSGGASMGVSWPASLSRAQAGDATADAADPTRA